MKLKFGTGVNGTDFEFEPKNRYKYVLKEKNAIVLRKTEIFAQVLLHKSVAMATP